MNKYFGNEPYYEENGRRIANVFPTMERFASTIGVDCDTLVEWSKPKNEYKYPGFSATYKRAKDYQINMLIQNGLQGLYSTSFAIFVCTSLLNARKKRLNLATHQNLNINYIAKG